MKPRRLKKARNPAEKLIFKVIHNLEIQAQDLTKVKIKTKI